MFVQVHYTSKHLPTNTAGLVSNSMILIDVAVKASSVVESCSAGRAKLFVLEQVKLSDVLSNADLVREQLGAVTSFTVVFTSIRTQEGRL